MSDDLTKHLRENPDVIAKKLLSDVFKKKNLFPWTSLNTVKNYIESNSDHSPPDKCLRAVLTSLLEKLKQSKPIHANIIYRIYWEKTQTKIVARDFNNKHGYAQNSGTFFKWLKDARQQFGTILLDHENQSNTDSQSSLKSEQSETPPVQASKPLLPNTILSILAPLEPEQRQLTRSARSISTLGITLFRLLPAFQYEFCEMLANGGQLRVLLVDPRSTAIKMASLRSDLGTPVTTQQKRVEDMLELLSRWKTKISNANIQVKLLNFLPPYGITIIYPRVDTDDAFCLVRLLTFRTSTSTAPTIRPDPIKEAYWFEFFFEQFEKMWEFSKPYELLIAVDRDDQRDYPD